MKQAVRVPPGQLQTAAQRIAGGVLPRNHQARRLVGNNAFGDFLWRVGPIGIWPITIWPTGTWPTGIWPAPAGAEACRQIDRHERLARSGPPFDEGHKPQGNPVSPEPEQVVGAAHDVDQRHVDAHLAPRFGLKERVFLVVEIQRMPTAAHGSLLQAFVLSYEFYLFIIKIQS